MRASKRALSAAVLTAAAIGLGQIAGPVASAETSTGWIGPTPAVDGVLYLHSSTINNVPRPLASTEIHTAFGSTAPIGKMGALARLFREGVLCAATDYLYNNVARSSQSVAASRDCGPGFYNSHGFVAVTTATTPSTFVTFPSSALAYPAPTTASEPAAGVNSRGQSFGSGEGVQTDAELPDLVAALGDNGTLGYVKGDELSTPAGSGAEAARTIQVYAEDGSTQVDTFTLQTG